MPVIDSVKIYSISLLRTYLVEKHHDPAFVRTSFELFSLSKDEHLCRELLIFSSSLKHDMLFEIDSEKVNQCRIVVDFFHQGALYKSLVITKQGNYFFSGSNEKRLVFNKNNDQINNFIKTFLGSYFHSSSIEMK